MKPVTEVTEDLKASVFDERILNIINKIAVVQRERSKTENKIRIMQNELGELNHDLLVYNNTISEAQTELLTAIMKKVQRSEHEIN